MTRSKRTVQQSPPPRPDLWSKWFNRLMQPAGAALIFQQAQLAEHPHIWLGLIGAAMMTGGAGLRLFVRGALRFLDEEGTFDDS